MPALLGIKRCDRCAPPRGGLEAWLEGRPFPEENYIVREGHLAPQYT